MAKLHCHIEGLITFDNIAKSERRRRDRYNDTLACVGNWNDGVGPSYPGVIVGGQGWIDGLKPNASGFISHLPMSSLKVRCSTAENRPEANYRPGHHFPADHVHPAEHSLTPEGDLYLRQNECPKGLLGDTLVCIEKQLHCNVEFTGKPS